MVSTPSIWVIIPAAGMGRRMGLAQPKQYMTLAGQCVIEHTLSRLLSVAAVTRISVALHPEDATFAQLSLAQHPSVVTINGGAERCDTVLAALECLQHQAKADDWVLVHDAARPCIRPSTIERLLQALSDNPVGGLLGVPVNDTLKSVSNSVAFSHSIVQHTVDRSSLWQAQTPQCFRYGVLKTALQRALTQGQVVTDEASAIEWAGYQPLMVMGDSDNIKLTRPQDQHIVEAILQHQLQESL